MFSKRCFSEWCVQTVVRGRRHQNALKQWCFQAFLVPLKGLSSVARQGEESEKHRLEPLGFLFSFLLLLPEKKSRETPFGRPVLLNLDWQFCPSKLVSRGT